ncbi:hypothetical protein GCM10020216_006320 [Nonomuraea helvata]
MQLRLTPTHSQADALAVAVPMWTGWGLMSWNRDEVLPGPALLGPMVGNGHVRTGRGVALEDLQGIRSRVRAHRLQPLIVDTVHCSCRVSGGLRRWG